MNEMIHNDVSRLESNQASISVNVLENRVAELQAALARKEAQEGYAKLVQTIKDVVQFATPKNSIVLTIARGDDDLLDFRGRHGWHFPRAVNGKFAGCYPADSGEAISHLENLRGQGSQFLLIPSTSFWWLEFYSDFTEHLQQQYRIVAYLENVCILYGLKRASGEA